MTQISPVVQQAYQLMQAGQLMQAAQMLQSALWSDPEDANAANLLGVAMARQGQLDDALVWFKEAARLAPEDGGAQVNIGNLLAAKGEFNEAIEAWLTAASKGVADPEVYNRVLAVMMQVGRYREATDLFLVASRDDQVLGRTLSTGIAGLLNAGRAEECVQVIRRAKALAGPNWQVARELLMPLLYWDKARPEEILREAMDLGRLIGMASPMDYRPHPNVPDPERPLKIGYISQDFRNQACGHFLEPLFEHHDRERFQLHAYYVGYFGMDELTQRIQRHAHQFLDVQHMAPELVYERIRADGIDILVDTVVHSSPHRVQAVARKPAPVVVNHLGYTGTSGLPAVEWRIVDRVTDPEGFERHSSETLVRLDRCFMCYAPPHHMIDVSMKEPPRPGGPVVFGSFNTLIKHQPATMDLWARVLKAVPSSRLVIKAKPLEYADVAAWYRQEFARRGIEGAQLELRSHTPTREEHLALYGQIDIALDPLPYNGMTTTFEALWMGVPVVAWEGDQSHSRVSASILRHTGLGQCVATSHDEYVRIAAELARSGETLTRWRRELRGMMRATVANGPAHARALEAAYRDIWRRYCEKVGGGRQ